MAGHGTAFLYWPAVMVLHHGGRPARPLHKKSGYTVFKGRVFIGMAYMRRWRVSIKTPGSFTKAAGQK
jgi:hypothetical protein